MIFLLQYIKKTVIIAGEVLHIPLSKVRRGGVIIVIDDVHGDLAGADPEIFSWGGGGFQPWNKLGSAKI